MTQKKKKPAKKERKLNITVTFSEDEKEAQIWFEKAVRCILKIDH